MYERTTLGLTAAQVGERIARGDTNHCEARTRSFADIVRANVLTRFNALLGALFVVAIVVAPPQDALFGGVILANTAIGIIQELRAKRSLDRLFVLTDPTAGVWRDRVLTRLPVEDLVLDDVFELSPGDQVPVDGRVLQGQELELDESLLTGESEPARKGENDELRSGSFVVAGRATVLATAVGEAAYAQKLTAEAQRYAKSRSELRAGIDRILQVIGWSIIPVGVVLIIGQLRSHDSVREAVRSSIAGLVGLVPEGLLLLTSMALAMGVQRVAKKGALVRELAALEGLARVDVVCLDKTGTLTEPNLVLHSVVAVGCGHDEPQAILGALAANDPNPNTSLRAIAMSCPSPDPPWLSRGSLRFSSARRISGATFEGHGSFLLGAPDALIRNDDHTHKEMRLAVEQQVAAGRRVLALGRTARLPDESEVVDFEPIAIIAIEEKIRTDAAETLAYFTSQGVKIKIFSGDHPLTVAAIARRLGMVVESPIDARTLPEESAALAAILEHHDVFGRVEPHQKKALVIALQGAGHVVAMTGDGVNDVPALKQADVGAAMGTGTPAARTVAEIVMLGDSFAALPHVVAEGRRAIANNERVATLFLTKSVYSAALALIAGLSLLPFPLLPRHLTIIGSLTIGIPGFFLALAPARERVLPGLVARVVRRSLPMGTIAATATLAAYLAMRWHGDQIQEQRTVAVLTLFTASFAVLLTVARPLNGWRIALLGSVLGSFIAMFLTPWIRRFLALSAPSLLGVAAGACASTVAVLAVFVSDRRVARCSALAPDQVTSSDRGHPLENDG